MNEEKQKRLIGAATVTAVLLVVILLAVMIFQLLAINTAKHRVSELEAAIAAYEKHIEEIGNDIEARTQASWIIRRARELGYKLPDDIVFD